MSQPVRRQFYGYRRGNLSSGTGIRCLPARPFSYVLTSIKPTKI